MKKIKIITAVLGVWMLASVPAHAATALPSAGITPDSPFYFLDRWAEQTQEFFTFNPETKARLQLAFAGERVAEIKTMVEKAGTVDLTVIEKTKGLLLANVAEAAVILKKEKSKGKDVTKLANEINTSFNDREKLLVKTFQDARKKLVADRKALLAKNNGVPVKVEQKVQLDTQAQSLAKEAANLKGMQNDIQTLFGEQQSTIVNELSPADKKSHEKESATTEKENKKVEKEIEKVEIDSEREIESEGGNSVSNESAARGEDARESSRTEGTSNSKNEGRGDSENKYGNRVGGGDAGRIGGERE